MLAFKNTDASISVHLGIKYGYNFQHEGTYEKPLPIATRKKTQLPPMESKPSTEDILNAILPPREWVENGKHYIQYVSH
jgi:dynein light intermediate chain